MDAGRIFSAWAARGVASVVALSMLLTAEIAPAAELPVHLGAIGVGKAKPEVESELRSLLRAELASAEFTRLKTNERYVLSATLVRLDSVQSSASARATCVVSVAILRDGSTLYALINGKAVAEDAKAPAARRDALRGAVHSAMTRVPRALR